MNIAARQGAGGGSYIGGPAPVVTYGGVPLTLATFGESPTQFYVDAWVYYMYNPTTGSSLPLSTTFTSPNANTDYAVSALTLGGVDTAAAPKVGNGNSQTDSVSVTVSNIPTNSWLNSVAATRTNLATINQTVTSGSYGSLLNTGPGGGGNAFWLQNNNGGAMSAGGMLMTGITSSSVTLNSQVGGSFRWGAAAAAFAPITGVFSINQPTTELNVAATTTNTLDFGGAPAVTLGSLTMHDSSSLTLANTPAASVTFSNIVAAGTGAAQIADGVAISLSDGGVDVASGETLTVATDIIAATNGLTKSGPGTLILSGTNTYATDTSILAGILSIGIPYLDDAADVYITTGGLLDLNTAAAIDTIDQLFFDGMPQFAGTWGSTLSAAVHQNDTYFSGTGVLNVTTSVPEPTSAALLLGGSVLLALRRRRSPAGA